MTAEQETQGGPGRPTRPAPPAQPPGYAEGLRGRRSGPPLGAPALPSCPELLRASLGDTLTLGRVSPTAEARPTVWYLPWATPFLSEGRSHLGVSEPPLTPGLPHKRRWTLSRWGFLSVSAIVGNACGPCPCQQPHPTRSPAQDTYLGRAGAEAGGSPSAAARCHAGHRG